MSEHEVNRSLAADVDMDTFEQSISFAGEEFRQRLVAQLIADLDRLRAALEVEDVAVQRSAAHELKGLGGTIGAERLAELAMLHEISIDTGLLDGRLQNRELQDEARNQLGALLAQIDGVSGLLATAAGDSEAA